MLESVDNQEDVESLSRALRDMLATGHASTSERLLATQLGVTRHRLRRALGALRDQGVIAPPRRRRAVDTGAADLAFHRLIAAASGNGLAAEFYALLRQVGTDVRLRVASNGPVCPNRVRQRDAEHSAIAAAIAGRDADAAEQAMSRHLEVVQQQILGRLTARRGAA